MQNTPLWVAITNFDRLEINACILVASQMTLARSLDFARIATMRVMIFEPQFAGHNLSYVKHLIARLAEIPCDVHLVTSHQALSSDEYQTHLGHLVGQFDCHALNGFVSRTGAQGISVNGPAACYSILSGLYNGLRKIQPDHVYVPCGNPIAHWTGIPNPVSRLLRRPGVEAEIVLLFGKYAYPHRGLRSRCKQWAALKALSRGPWTRIHHIVPHAIRVMQAFSPSMKARCRLLPDPVEPAPNMSSNVARKLLRIPESGRYISLVGLIERRKGVFQLLDAYEVASDRIASSDRVLLAGRQTDEVREALGSRYQGLMSSGRVIAIDRHLTSEELWASCCAANVITTPYPHHKYSASIVIRAAAMGIPVLANAIGWMREVIERYSLGTTCNTNDRDEFAANLSRTLEQSHDFRLSPEGKQFVDYNSSENFSHHLADRISERLSLAQRLQSA